MIKLITILSIIFILLALYFYIKNNKEKNELIVKNDIELPTIEIIENDDIVPSNQNKIIDQNIKNELISLDNSLPQLNKAKKTIKESKKILDKNNVYFATSKANAKKMHKITGKGKKILDKTKNKEEIYIGNQYLKNKNGTKVKNTRFTKKDGIKKFAKKEMLNAGFQVASVVVSQYYMNEINNKLEDISEEISTISSFLETEYKSKIVNIINNTEKIIKYQYEILNNKEKRKIYLNLLINDEQECNTLLAQANLELQDLTVNNAENLDYKKYEQRINKIHNWYIKQQNLKKILLEIENLKALLSDNLESEELNYELYNKSVNQINNVNKNLEIWNNNQIKKFGIDVEKERREGKLFKFKKNTIGLLNENCAYCKIDNNLANKINFEQKDEKIKVNNFKKVIKIQKYKGDYYNIIDE